MDAKGTVVDRPRVLRLAFLSLAAGGAAVVAGVLLGGSQASASDGSGLLDDVLGGTTHSIVDTTGALGGAVTQTVEAVAPVTAPVVAAVAPVVTPVAPVVQQVAAPIVQVVEAVPTLTSVVTPVAAQLDGVVAAVPVVRDLVTAPVGTVTVPVVGVVDDVIAGTTDVVGEVPGIGAHPGGPPAVVAPIDASGSAGAGDRAGAADVAGEANAGAGLDAIDLAAALAQRAAATEALGASSDVDVAVADAAAVSGLLPSTGELAGDAPGGDFVPAPLDERGTVAPTASAAAPGAPVADATHDSHRSAGALRGALAGDDLLPASVVGDHDSSPD